MEEVAVFVLCSVFVRLRSLPYLVIVTRALWYYPISNTKRNDFVSKYAPTHHGHVHPHIRDKLQTSEVLTPQQLKIHYPSNFIEHKPYPHHNSTPSRMGRSGPSRVGPSAIGNKNFASLMPSLLENKPQSSSTSHIPSGKSEVLNGLLEYEAAWKTQNDSHRKMPQIERKSEDGLTKSMAGLAMSTAPKADLSVPEWRRQGPRSFAAVSRVQSGLTRKPDLAGRTLVSTASRASCTFTRSWDQPRMAEAGFLNYYPFHKHEFALGTIIRGVIHEQDIMNTPRPAPPNPPTAFTNAGKEHVTHGDFGPVYSENRFLIVVNNRPGDHYLAVPVYSHKGNGLAKKLHRDEYISVADHRYLANCQQQSAHAPLVTEFLKDGVEELLPMSAAYASYPVSRKYGLPVAHQGRLDDESTKRLVAMYLKWGRPCED